MQVEIKIEFGGEIFPFFINWELPFFPSVGDCIELDDFLTDEQFDEMIGIKLIGTGKFGDFKINLCQLFTDDCYAVKITQINWMKKQAEVFVKNENFKEIENWLKFE
jgi:hypothetical protein